MKTPLIAIILLFSLGLGAAPLSELTDRQIGWAELGALSSTMAKLDRYMGHIVKADRAQSRFEILELIAHQAHAEDFEQGEITLVPVGIKLKCSAPVISWQSVDSLTAIRTIQFFVRGCGRHKSVPMIQVSWVSHEQAVININPQNLDLLWSVGSAAELNLKYHCRVDATTQSVQAIRCKDLNYLSDGIGDVVLKDVRWVKGQKLSANGRKYKLLQSHAEIRIEKAASPGSVAVMTTRKTSEDPLSAYLEDVNEESKPALQQARLTYEPQVAPDMSQLPDGVPGQVMNVDPVTDDSELTEADEYDDEEDYGDETYADENDYEEDSDKFDDDADSNFNS